MIPVQPTPAVGGMLDWGLRLLEVDIRLHVENTHRLILNSNEA